MQRTAFLASVARPNHRSGSGSGSGKIRVRGRGRIKFRVRGRGSIRGKGRIRSPGRGRFRALLSLVTQHIHSPDASTQRVILLRG